MDIYRILGAALIALSGAQTVILLNESAIKAVRSTEAAVLLLRELRSDIECFMLPVSRALERCSQELYHKLGYASESPPRTFSELVERGNISDTETKRILSRLGDSLGLGYRDEQLSLCDGAIAQLEERRRQLSDQLPAKRRLNASLCMSGALAAVILLL